MYGVFHGAGSELEIFVRVKGQVRVYLFVLFWGVRFSVLPSECMRVVCVFLVSCFLFLFLSYWVVRFILCSVICSYYLIIYGAIFVGFFLFHMSFFCVIVCVIP